MGHFRIRGSFRAFSLLIISALFLFALPFWSRADMVTDTLTIKVGYAGMELSEYVEAGSYHWSELYENLNLYSYAYSYYQSGKGDEFTAIVDSANGFLLTDILDYANLYYGDIYNLKFYVMDHQGIQASVDRDTLFATRYYFHDYNYNARYYDEDGKVVFNTDNCYSDCEEVPPMMAIEDNWASFNQEFEHAEPDFDYMNSGNRFRLLFGQTNPTETLTSQSAKYVSCIYVTLYGSPSYGETPELDGSYGAHQTEIVVNTSNEKIRDVLSDVLKLDSTNKDVMVIRGYTVEKDDFYSDVAHVIIDYEIIGDGEASIAGSVGGAEISGDIYHPPTVFGDHNKKSGNESGQENPEATETSASETDSGKEEKPEETSSAQDKQDQSKEEETRADSAAESKPDSGTDKDKSSETDKDKASNADKDKTSEPDKNQGQEDSGAKKDKKPDPDSSLKQDSKTPDKSEELKSSEELKASKPELSKVSGLYALNDSVSDKLSSMGIQKMEAAADQNITQVKREDNREEKAALERKYLYMLCGASLLLMLMGAAFGNIRFRKSLKR